MEGLTITPESQPIARQREGAPSLLQQAPQTPLTHQPFASQTACSFLLFFSLLPSVPYSQISSLFILPLFLSKHGSEHQEDGGAPPHPISQVDVESHRTVKHPRLLLGARVFSRAVCQQGKIQAGCCDQNNRKLTAILQRVSTFKRKETPANTLKAS